ncbi:MAG: carbohydrate kinase family protein [Anaerolineae bacterium]|nr:carbohydrate kinase family protein [Anaerolineae bacterium]
MRNEIPKAVVAGHLCLDIIPDLSGLEVKRGADFFVPGKVRLVGPATLSTGGPVSNTGLALVRLGIDTALMGKVGDDPFGSLIRLLLADWGVTEGVIVVAGETSSYTIVLDPPGLDRMFLHRPGTNDTFSAADVNYDLVAGRDLFHFGYPPIMRRMYSDGGRELLEIFRRVQALGVTTSLDMAMPDPGSEAGRADWQAILAGVMPTVDIFLPSAEELLYMLERQRFDDYQARHGEDMLALFTGDDLSRLSERLLAMGGKVVGIKCGYRGVYVRTAGKERLAEMGKVRPADLDNWADRELWEPSFHVEHFAGGTGAGDSCIAGFLSAFLRGHTLEETVRYACAAGGFNVTAPDALSGLRPWPEIVARVQAGWEKNPLRVEGHGWHCDAGGLWHGPHDRR